jgi:hypothetical protein
MNEKVDMNVQQYFTNVDQLLNDDKKYVKNAERVDSISEVSQNIDTQFNCYEVKYQLQMNNNFTFKNKDEIQKVLENHLGSLFALLDGGSITIPIESMHNDELIIKVRYAAKN